ncbi:DUF4345 domain-containing protein [Flavipsychrobacter stenotrophus]|uniref:DUF4345 domain-containing protein n=1 Tax=Flavipsychrobacter stenotrophus TaxID=2077091 RepID=A0A2S7SZJ3_9BACT|nr:DUF4345 domain-containing protein [Flavipsychrobacter stenotrophus]PQJ11936.1 DUF4345 domain-containing protein [Flavipsychrobacter stenotrophus]
MNKQKVVTIAARIFMGLSAFSLLYVSVMALCSPQAVMDLVQVKLSNADAFSSIRGIYGGVGLTITVSVVYMLVKDVQKGLVFLCMLWGFYALSRIITIYTEGSLGAFGTQCLKMESFFFVISVALLVMYKPKSRFADSISSPQ